MCVRSSALALTLRLLDWPQESQLEVMEEQTLRPWPSSVQLPGHLWSSGPAPKADSLPAQRTPQPPLIPLHPSRGCVLRLLRCQFPACAGPNSSSSVSTQQRMEGLPALNCLFKQTGLWLYLLLYSSRERWLSGRPQGQRLTQPQPAALPWADNLSLSELQGPHWQMEGTGDDRVHLPTERL